MAVAMNVAGPLLLLLVVLSGIAVWPYAGPLVRRIRFGLAVLRSELIVQAARRAYERRNR